jgi:hypothetical protein
MRARGFGGNGRSHKIHSFAGFQVEGPVCQVKPHEYYVLFGATPFVMILMYLAAMHD